jgi:hypothetical protein
VIGRPRTLAAVALALLVAGCGSSSPPISRPAIAAYVIRVNTIETQLAAPLKTVTVAGARLAASTNTVNHVQVTRLRRAGSQIRALRRKLSRLPAPGAARQLRILVLLLAGGEVDMTNELSGLFEFLPRYNEALREIGPSTTQLQIALAGRAGGSSGARAALDADARALDRYRTALAALARTLRSLMPPPVAKPQYGAELRALSAMQASAGTLAQALTSGSRDAPSKLVVFERAAVQTESLPAQRVEIAAIRSYDASVAKLDTLAQQIAEVRLKLAQTIS